MKRTAAVAAATFILLAMATTPAWASGPIGGQNRHGCDVGQMTTPPPPPHDIPDVPPPPPIDVPLPTTRPGVIHTDAPPPPPAVEAPAEPTRTKPHRPTEDDHPAPPTRATQQAPAEEDEPDHGSRDDVVTEDVEPLAFAGDLGRPDPCGHDGRDHGRDQDHHGRGDRPSWPVDWSSWGDHPVFVNCAHARAVGAAPIREGERGYRLGLDSDHDGIACETGSDRHDSDDGDDDSSDDSDSDDSSSDDGDDDSSSSGSTVTVSDYSYSGSIPVPVGGVATGGGPANR